VWRRKPCRSGKERFGRTREQRNRIDPRPGSLECVIKRGEIVDERWQWSHRGAEIELRGKDQKTARGNRISSRDTRVQGMGVQQVPGPRHEALGSPVILGGEGDRGEAK